ncbi:hypothetical protein G3M48_003823 [Beauveria asiatica]|uniref:Uncharacterized protein n=1 Tax=Beauveria asiatica TaxID=1069075 RepID=A0AAW0RV51_9HYPO
MQAAVRRRSFTRDLFFHLCAPIDCFLNPGARPPTPIPFRIIDIAQIAYSDALPIESAVHCSPAPIWTTRTIAPSQLPTAPVGASRIRITRASSPSSCPHRAAAAFEVRAPSSIHCYGALPGLARCNRPCAKNVVVGARQHMLAPNTPSTPPFRHPSSAAWKPNRLLSYGRALLLAHVPSPGATRPEPCTEDPEPPVPASRD